MSADAAAAGNVVRLPVKRPARPLLALMPIKPPLNLRLRPRMNMI